MKVELHQQDCIEGMQSLPRESVDVIVTSPPYNIGKKYGTHVDKMSPQEYSEFTARWLVAAHDVLKPKGSLFLNVGAQKQPDFPHRIALAALSCFQIQNTIHWIKSITVTPKKGEDISVGHFKPINSPRYLNDCHEYVFHLTKDGDVPICRKALGVPYADKSNVARWGATGGQDIRCRGNNWYIPYPTIQKRADRPHPATFPPMLAHWCIRLAQGAVAKYCVVLDPFVGVGSAGIGARDAGAGHFIGFDIDADYLKTAREDLSLVQ